MSILINNKLDFFFQNTFTNFYNIYVYNSFKITQAAFLKFYFYKKINLKIKNI